MGANKIKKTKQNKQTKKKLLGSFSERDLQKEGVIVHIYNMQILEKQNL